MYREETTWILRLEAGADFPEDYDGELDGYAWRERFFREVQPRVLAAVLRELAALPGWSVRTGNRGLPAQDEVLIHVNLDEGRRALPVIEES
jgi:hypothetical protein